ncbi:MAG: electron transfer flavoprotein subunit alpha/FixB family protein [Candidatus Eisenbacteria sp.]|nr:electron transfer flavoprotein subunit alpha/FixB family protein [Candidatus Eisenbacteria bacterium]
MAGEIWTIAETRDGEVRKPTLDVLSKCRQMAGVSGARVALVLPGKDAETAGKTAAAYGADILYLIEHDELAGYRSEPFAKAIADLAAEKKPDTVLLPATAQGKDLAPRLAAQLGTGLVSDCIEVDSNPDGNVTFTRPIFAGKALETVSIPDARPRMATLRPKVFPPGEADSSRQVEVIRVAADIPAEVLGKTVREIVQADTGRVELTEADFIIAGGRGMKEPDSFRIIDELADTLGGAVGASRAAVDAGWRDHQDQVGQTGKTVTPSLYIACGISGAIQHLAGMSSAKCIVAINKDPEAPIFKIADYGIVGDLFEVVPALNSAFKKAKL